LDDQGIDYKLVFGQYVVGMLFLPNDDLESQKIMTKVEEILKEFYMPGKV